MPRKRTNIKGTKYEKALRFDLPHSSKATLYQKLDEMGFIWNNLSKTWVQIGYQKKEELRNKSLSSPSRKTNSFNHPNICFFCRKRQEGKKELPEFIYFGVRRYMHKECFGKSQRYSEYLSNQKR